MEKFVIQIKYIFQEIFVRVYYVLIIMSIFCTDRRRIFFYLNFKFLFYFLQRNFVSS